MNKEILYRFFQGSATLQEEVQVREWMESSADNEKEFYRERKMFDSILLLSDEKRFLSNFTHTLFDKFKVRELVKVAAVAAVTLVVTFTFQYFTKNSKELALQTITVPAGQRINIELPDGTNVWLNSRSKMKYPTLFAADERKVILDGEAYFEVSHNKKKPFIVETSKGNIEVLGTKFNVEAYSDNNAFVTSLMEGSVKVIRGNAQLLLKPDEMAYLRGGKLESKPIQDYNLYRWIEGLVCFNNESFLNIMDKFEKCYGIAIKVENKNVLSYRCTGKFRQTDGISYALRVLQRDVNFSFERDDEKHIIYIK